MARTYAYCVGAAPLPDEVAFYSAIKMLGVRAVTGRDVLSAREVRDCFAAKYAESLMIAFTARKLSKNQGDWDAAHPQEAQMITRSQRDYLKLSKDE